jgi:hypothetical protein
MELQEHILVPFTGWKARHEDRVETARDDMLGKGGLIASWEKEVNKLMGVSGGWHSHSAALCPVHC